MERKHKIIIGAVSGAIIIGAGAMYLPSLLRAGNAAPALDVIPSAMVHKIDLSGITIRLDVNIKNPTKADFKMKYPYFRLVYKGDTVGTSQSINQDIGMTHLDEANFNNILFTVPLLSAFTVASALIKAASGTEAAAMTLEVITHVDPYWKYEDENKTWKRLPNLGNAGLIEIKQVKPITLRKQTQS